MNELKEITTKAINRLIESKDDRACYYKLLNYTITIQYDERSNILNIVYPECFRLFIVKDIMDVFYSNEISIMVAATEY